MWKDDEKNISSTWRESWHLLRMNHKKRQWSGLLITKVCEKIVHSGSMKHHLQVITYNISENSKNIKDWFRQVQLWCT